MKCQNCEKESLDHFCPNCGQKMELHRINGKYVFQEIPSTIFQIDRGYFYTALELFKNPAQTIKNFLAGKRKSLMKPLAFLVTNATIYFLITKVLNVSNFIEDAFQGWMDGFKDGFGGTSESNIDSMQSFLNHYYIIIILLMIPFFSLSTYWVFKKSGYNYFENVVLNMYILGQQFLINSLVVLMLHFNENLEGTGYYLGILYNCWVLFQFSSKKNVLIRILQPFLYYALLILIIILPIILSVLFYKIF